MEETNQADQHYVDTSRPFTSVKEAVAIFGQRIMLPGPTHITASPKPTNSKPASPITASPRISYNASFPSPPIHTHSAASPKPISPIVASPRISYTDSSPSPPLQTHIAASSKPVSPIAATSPSPGGSREEFMDVLKKLEAEITETKTEVRKLKKRETETEVALANLNAELHKNMSKMAKAEADAAGKRAAAMATSVVSVKETKEKENGEEERRKMMMRRMEKEYPTLAQILDSNKGDRNEYFATIKKKEKKKKKKPIIPLVGDFLFFKKKGPVSQISAPLYTTSSNLQF